MAWYQNKWGGENGTCRYVTIVLVPKQMRWKKMENADENYWPGTKTKEAKKKCDNIPVSNTI